MCWGDGWCEYCDWDDCVLCTEDWECSYSEPTYDCYNDDEYVVCETCYEDLDDYCVTCWDWDEGYWCEDGENSWGSVCWDN